MPSPVAIYSVITAARGQTAPPYSRSAPNALDDIQSGGGAGLGILLGPLGALANGKLIESQTTADAALLNDKGNLMPRTLFADAAQKNGLVLGTSPEATRATSGRACRTG